MEAHLRPGSLVLIVIDGDEAFAMEAVEAMFYEIVSATREELIGLEQAQYRLLKLAPDFETIPGCLPLFSWDNRGTDGRETGGKEQMHVE